jgi:methionyl-tRNA formyltransferase
MGTPRFALPSLQALIDRGHEIAAVVTQPDKPQGRHAVLTPPPVKVLAQNNNIRVLQPQTLRDSLFFESLCALMPEVIVVAAYGKIFPRDVLAIPPRGCLNIHGSLLPHYRGAAPIQRAVMQGEEKTGVTIMQMDSGLDTGDILLSKSIVIHPDETAGELFERIALLGADCLCEALQNLDGLTPVKQDEAMATWAPPLTREDGKLDFSDSAKCLYARIRGVTPQPGAYCQTGFKKLKILKAAVTTLQGEVGVLLDSKRLVIGCGEASLELLEVQPEGSKRMPGNAYINGKRMKPGDSILFAHTDRKAGE